jgi:hypothetical protein
MSEIRIAAGTATPALGLFLFAAVGPAARTDGAADVPARAVDPGLAAPFDFDGEGATDPERVGVTEACVVGFVLEDCRGVDEGVLDGAG